MSSAPARCCCFDRLWCRDRTVYLLSLCFAACLSDNSNQVASVAHRKGHYPLHLHKFPGTASIRHFPEVMNATLFGV